MCIIYTPIFGEVPSKARFQLIIPDEDRDQFAHLEGMILSGWLRAAAEDRIRQRGRLKPFTSSEDVREFFAAHDDSGSASEEPDWEEHLQALGESRLAGTSST